MSNIEGEKYTQMPLNLPYKQEKPNQFNHEPAADPLTVFEDNIDEGRETEPYIVPPSEPENEDVLDTKQEVKPTVAQKSNTAWWYQSERPSAKAYANRGLSNPADKD